MSYDFTEAEDFLRHEAETTPEELLEELRGAMASVGALETKRNRKAARAIWGTLLTCSDFMERITPKEERRAV